MKFRYKRYPYGILRPIIPIEVMRGSRSLKYEVLVDSGADSCIFDAQVGEELGIPVKMGHMIEVSGITGTEQPCYVHEVAIRIGGWPFTIQAGFLPGMSDLGHGVVGQRGFFDLFIVKFDLLKEEIDLKPRK